VLGTGSKAMHLAYLGDALIGERVNIGAGTITCNYDGVNKNTTTIEDGAFIGSRAVVVEGVVVGAGAVIAPNVVLSASIPVIDVTGSQPVEHRGYVPPRSVVLPGSRAKEYPAGTYDLPCALIVGTRSASTDLKTSLNDVLREFEIAT